MQHALARPDLTVSVCTFCDTLWPEVQSHSDDNPVHTPGPHRSSACALAQAHPTMSCIHVVTVVGYEKRDQNTIFFCCFSSCHHSKAIRAPASHLVCRQFRPSTSQIQR